MKDRLLAEQDEILRKRLGRLDQDIQLGLDQAARGDFCDADEIETELNQIIADAF
jgi:hypothetical protein